MEHWNRIVPGVALASEGRAEALTLLPSGRLEFNEPRKRGSFVLVVASNHSRHAQPVTLLAIVVALP